MLAFLKRRWVLLSCVIVLMTCSVVDFDFGAMPKDGSTLITEYVQYCVQRGNFAFARGNYGVLQAYILRLPEEEQAEFQKEGRVHWPMLGKRPRYRASTVAILCILPLWLPLSAVLGWIVIRELRWREKRAKSASLAT